MTAAAIGYSSAWPPPVLVSTDRRREASTMPPSTAMNEQKREAGDLHAVDVDARAPRRLGVAADGVDVAAEARAVEDVGPEQEQGADQQRRVRDAAVLVGHGDHDHQRARDADDPERDDQHRVGAQPGLASATAAARAARRRRSPRATITSTHETPGARKSLASADDEVVLQDHRALAADQQQHDAVPRQQSGERDHERGHADLGDDQAVQRADREPGAEHDHEHERGRQHVAVRRQQDRGQHAADARHEADREVDLARAAGRTSRPWR